MKEILFFKGNHETIILPENSSRVKIFYNELYKLFENKDYKYKNIETYSEGQLEENISSNTRYLIGHSQGATRVLEQFSSETYPQVKGIILFDPQQYVEKKWNALQIPKLLFVNTRERWHDYKNFQKRIEIDDNHCFANSIEKVIPVLKNFIK